MLKRTLLALISLVLITTYTFSQTCGGDIIRGVNSSPPRTNHFLDPNGDGRIVTPSFGTGFSDCSNGYVDEMTQFEDLTNPTGCSSCQVGWTKIAIGDETSSDLWAGGGGCGNTDIVPDSPTGAYGYFTVRDPDGICNNGDELLIFRIRLDANVSGAFSYSILFDADGLIGPDDPQGVVCGTKGANGGFEYEIVANPGNSGFIQVRNIDGVYGSYGTNAQHDNSVASANYPNTTNYTQANACRSICSTTPCNSSGAVYHTFAIRLTDVGESCGGFDFRFAGMSSSSGGGTVSSGTSVSDLGGAGPLDCGAGTIIPCNCCVECNDVNSDYYCAGAGGFDNCLFGCVTGCVSTTNNPLPVVLGSFYGLSDDKTIQLNWITLTELGSDYFEISRSSDGLNFVEVGKKVRKSQPSNSPFMKTTGTLPGILLGITYYDLQTNGSMPHRISYFEEGNDKSAQVIWMGAVDMERFNPPHPTRGSYYSLIDMADPLNPEKYTDIEWERIEGTTRSGFPSIIQYEDGSVGSIAHVISSESSASAMRITKNTSFGDIAFTSKQIPGADSSLWGHATVDGDDITHLVFTSDTSSKNFSEQVVYLRSTDKGNTWSDPTILTGPLSNPRLPTGRGANSYQLATRGSNVVLGYQDTTFNLIIIKSEDNGETWSQPINVFGGSRHQNAYMIEDYGDGTFRATTDTVPICGPSFDIVIDADGFVHGMASTAPSWNIGTARMNDEGQIEFTDDTTFASIYTRARGVYFNEQANSYGLTVMARHAHPTGTPSWPYPVRICTCTANLALALAARWVT